MTCEAQVTFDSPQWKTISREAIDLCTQLLMKKPEERLTLDKMIVDPWFKKLSPKFLANL